MFAWCRRLGRLIARARAGGLLRSAEVVAAFRRVQITVCFKASTPRATRNKELRSIGRSSFNSNILKHDGENEDGRYD